MRKFNSTPFFTPYVNWRIRLDYTRFPVHGLRSRQFCDTLTSKPAIQSNTNWRLYESVVNLNLRLVIKSCVYKSYALTTWICSVYTYELSSVQFHLFIFNLSGKWRLWNNLSKRQVSRHQREFGFGIKWCSCTLLTQRTDLIL